MFPLPNLPDSIHKITILMGVACLVGSFYLISSIDSKNDKLFNRVDNLTDSLSIQEMQSNLAKEELLDADTVMSIRFKRDKQISTKSSNVVFTRIITGDSIGIRYTDSLRKYWNAWKTANSVVSVLNQKIDFINSQIKRDKKGDDETYLQSIIFIILGGILFLLGLLALEKKESQNFDLTLRQNIGLPKYYDTCQSCSKRFSPMICYGKEVDDKLNYAFCVGCYSNGAFTDENMTLEGMKNKISQEIAHLKDRRKRRILKSLERLVRWKTDKF